MQPLPQAPSTQPCKENTASTKRRREANRVMGKPGTKYLPQKAKDKVKKAPSASSKKKKVVTKTKPTTSKKKQTLLSKKKPKNK